jgi:hypothetical protein
MQIVLVTTQLDGIGTTLAKAPLHRKHKPKRRVKGNAPTLSNARKATNFPKLQHDPTNELLFPACALTLQTHRTESHEKASKIRLREKKSADQVHAGHRITTNTSPSAAQLSGASGGGRWWTTGKPAPRPGSPRTTMTIRWNAARR